MDGSQRIKAPLLAVGMSTFKKKGGKLPQCGNVEYRSDRSAHIPTPHITQTKTPVFVEWTRIFIPMSVEEALAIDESPEMLPNPDLPALLWLIDDNVYMQTAEAGPEDHKYDPPVQESKYTAAELALRQPDDLEGNGQTYKETVESDHNVNETDATGSKLTSDGTSDVSDGLENVASLLEQTVESALEQSHEKDHQVSPEINTEQNLQDGNVKIKVKNDVSTEIADQIVDREKSADKIEDPESDIESEEEDPPILKYSRLNQVPANFFKNDPVSAATFNETVFIFGTHSGSIHLCNPEFTAIRTFKAHRASVLSLYTDGIYFASCSMDGTIVIGSIADAQDIVRFDYKRPIHAVVLDRNYQRTRSFICGGMSGNVIYSSKNWLDQRVDVVLAEDHGPIISIQAVDDLLLWMNDLGITFYHVPARQVISVVEKPSNAFRSDLYWPRVCFPETDRVLMAWGNYIWSFRVSLKTGLSGNTGAGSSVKSRLLPSAASLLFRSVPEKSVSVEHFYQVDYLISGIASFDEDQWIVLTYNPPKENPTTGRLEPENPDLKRIKALDGATIHEEEIGLDFVDNLGLNDFSLGYHIGPSSTRYFIICARGGVVAQKIQLDDRLQWYLDRQSYHKAWSMSKHLVKPLERLRFGLKHLDQLLELKNWKDATSWMADLLFLDSKEFPMSDTKSTLATRISSTLQLEDEEIYAKEVRSEWDKYCATFIQNGHERELTAVIPKDPRWSLQKNHYSKILVYWLSLIDETDKAYQLLKEWDLELFEVDIVTGTIELILELGPDNSRLRRILCEIYENSYEPVKVVRHMCILRDAEIIQFLDQNHILPLFISSIPKFIKLQFENDSDIELLPINQLKNKLKDVIAILVQRRFEISPTTIVKIMAENHLEVVTFFYLEELAAINDLIVQNLEDTRAQLYCQFDRPKLLPFLMDNHYYDIPKVIEMCETFALVDELVYLLGKTGENKKALRLIMEELDDPQRAINFAKTQTDPAIWNSLLEYSFSRPTYIKALIELSDDQSCKFYNPITILQRMNTEVNIEGFKESITTVSLDNDLNVVLNQLILSIVYKKSEELSKKLNSDMLRGFLFSVDSEDVRKIADVFETYVITLTGTNSKPQIGLVSGALQADEFAYRLSTDLAAKLRHVHSLSAKLLSRESCG